MFTTSYCLLEAFTQFPLHSHLVVYLQGRKIEESPQAFEAADHKESGERLTKPSYTTPASKDGAEEIKGIISNEAKEVIRHARGVMGEESHAKSLEEIIQSLEIGTSPVKDDGVKGALEIFDKEDGQEILLSLKNKDSKMPLLEELESLARWVALFTEHASAVKDCFSMPKTTLQKMRISVIQIQKFQELSVMADLRVTLIPYKDRFNTEHDIFEELLEKLSAKTASNTSSGTYHCEAILASLKALATSYLTHKSVSPEAIEFARSLQVDMGAATTKCCPVCFWLLHVCDPAFTSKNVSYGRHTKITPCCPPPWLPREYFLKVMQEVEEEVGLWYQDQIWTILSRRTKSTGSSAGRRSSDGTMARSDGWSGLDSKGKRRRMKDKLYGDFIEGGI